MVNNGTRRQQPGGLRSSVLAGFATFGAMLSLFLILKNSGSGYVLYFQFFNCALVIPGVVYSVKFSQRRSRSGYIASLFAGVAAALVAAILFAFFLVIYLNFINPVYMYYVLKKGALGEFMSPLILASVFLTEQVCTGLIAALITANYLKEGRVGKWWRGR
jgi:hypothetical protein